MGEMTASLLGERVREARKRRGLTQTQLADLVRMDRTFINKIETGTRRVAALELSDIADALRVQMVTFFQEPTPSLVSHRSSQGLDTVDSAIDQLLAELAADVEFVRNLSTIDLGATRPEEHSPPTTTEEAEKLAADARRKLRGDPNGPIGALSSPFEELGFFLFAQDLGADTADAGTLLLDDGTGVTILNSANKVGRRRLAAVHEFGHFLVADDYTIDWRVSADSGKTESLIDRFARAFLAPAMGLANVWRKHRRTDGVRVAAVIAASKYQIDMSTLARRLQETELVDARDAGTIRQTRTTQADMIEHDLHPHHEFEGTSQPRKYQRAVLQLARDEEISRERAVELLWNTLGEADMPERHLRAESEIWQYVA